MNPPDTLYMSPQRYALYLMALDKYGIYAQRRALNMAGIPTQVYRGEEWWH